MQETSTAAIPHTYYVSPTGDDTNQGTTPDQSFKTIERARAFVSSIAGNMSEDIIIHLRGGTYNLSETLGFGPGDSGTNGHNVIYQAYPGERPVISGGQTIAGWSLADKRKNIWQAPAKDIETRQLYVNGVRATRARSRVPSGTFTQTPDGYTTTDTSMQSWGNQGDIEFIYTGWPATVDSHAERRCGVSSIKDTSGLTTITMNKHGYQFHRPFCLPSYIENACKLLTAPGQWYLDRSEGIVYYIPRPDENMAEAEVIAPILETLVSGTGTLDHPVHNIQFKGITFAYATWLQPSRDGCFLDNEANVYNTDPGDHLHAVLPPGNISFRGAKAIQFERNVFAHLGGVGLRFWDNSQNNIVIGNVFTDISGTAVMIGGDTDIFPPMEDTGNQVTNNYIHDVAVEYRGGVGLFGSYLKNTTIMRSSFSTKYRLRLLLYQVSIFFYNKLFHETKYIFCRNKPCENFKE